MGVRPGYKLTEVGAIPGDWDVQYLARLASIRGGIAKNSKAVVSDPVTVHYLRVANVQDGFLDLSEMSRIDVGRQDLSRYALLPGDVLMNEGGDRDKLGRGAIWRGQYNPCVHQNHVFVVRCRSKLAPEYLDVWTGGRPARRFFLLAGKQTTNLASISKSSLGKLPVAVPPLSEQRAIATALGDVDALLEGLTRLIAKKRDLKQAAMQQLLSGRTRLPGFARQWDDMTLGDLGSTFGGLTGKTKADFGEGSARYVTYMDVMSNVVIDSASFERVNVAPEESQNQVVKDDLLFTGSSETPGEVAMCAAVKTQVSNLFLNSFCFGFRFRDPAGADALYMAYYLRSSEGRELVKSLAQGSTRYNLSKGALLRVRLCVPSPTEQAAIAAVLSDMDSELSALEARRDKTRALKQAIMQELLSGRTRLEN